MKRTPKTKLAQVCAALNAEKAEYIVFGATALQLWGSTRATRDIDILVNPTVPNVKRVLKALGRLGFGFAKDLVAEDVASQPVTMVGDTPNIDILTRAWNVKYADAKPRIELFEVEGVLIPAASIADLIESKRTGRLQDAADIEILNAIIRLRQEPRPG